MKILDKLFNGYIKNVDNYVEERFNKILKPWLVKKGYSFLAGNGDFYILNKEGSMVDPLILPSKIYNTLMEPVPGTRITVGCIMPGYKHNER